MLASFFIAFILTTSQPLSSSHQAMPDCNEVPSLNKSILQYVKNQIGKKVGTGQCWDLAAGALNTHKAKWNGQYEYGRLVKPSEECVYPGDIIQFDGILIEVRLPNGYRQEEMPHHTAIVYEVHAKGNYTIAHQNYGNSSKKVLTTPLELKNIKRGKIKIYRPQV